MEAQPVENDPDYTNKASGKINLLMINILLAFKHATLAIELDFDKQQSRAGEGSSHEFYI